MRNSMTLSLGGVIFLASLAPCPTLASNLITFEKTPTGATPIDNSALSNPYNIDVGSVQFFFDTNKNNIFDVGIDLLPVFEKTGSADVTSGFSRDGIGGDIPKGGSLGQWFLRQPTSDPVPPPFIIDYNTTQSINALSGEIWDIDTHTYSEQWSVEVLDSIGTVITSLNSPVGLSSSNPNSLDALPWTFLFSNLTDLSADVDKVRITFTGTKFSGVGLAFNNYNADRAVESVPEPTSLLGFLTLGSFVVSSTLKRKLNLSKLSGKAIENFG